MRLIIPLLAATAACTAYEAEDDPTDDVTYVPISGSPLARIVNANDGDLDGLASAPPTGSCLPFLPGLRELGAWSLQIVSASSGCLGTSYRDRFEVHSDGEVLWQRAGLPDHRLRLTGAQLERIRLLDRLDCVRTIDFEYGESFYDVGVGLFDGPTYVGQGAHIAEASAMGAQLRRILDDAIAAWADDRVAQLGPVDIRLAATGKRYAEPGAPRPYDVHLVDRELTISRDGRVIARQALSPVELAGTVDWALTLGAKPPEDRSALVATGRLDLGGRTTPVWVGEVRIELPAAEALLRGAYEASDYDGEP